MTIIGGPSLSNLSIKQIYLSLTSVPIFRTRAKPLLSMIGFRTVHAHRQIRGEHPPWTLSSPPIRIRPTQADRRKRTSYHTETTRSSKLPVVSNRNSESGSTRTEH